MDRLYGRHAVRECLRAKRRGYVRLLIADGVQHDSPVIAELRALATQHGVPVVNAPREALDHTLPQNHGVVLECGEFPLVNLDDIFDHATEASTPPLILVLDTIQDPQNLGTLIRTADAAGVNGIVLPLHRSASITPSVVHASSGAVEHMRVAQVVNLARMIDELKERGVWVASLHGDEHATDLFETNLTGGLALVVGNEGEGVRRLLRDKSDYILKLPMLGNVESLNAAVAGSVALYEVVRQRRIAVANLTAR